MPYSKGRLKGGTVFGVDAEGWMRNIQYYADAKGTIRALAEPQHRSKKSKIGPNRRQQQQKRGWREESKKLKVKRQKRGKWEIVVVDVFFGLIKIAGVGSIRSANKTRKWVYLETI